MRWPPYLLKLKFHNDRHRFELWIPLFIIGPLFMVFILAIFLIILPFAFMAFIFTWRWDWLAWVAMGITAILRVCWSLPGVTVQVDGRDGKVDISIV